MDDFSDFEAHIVRHDDFEADVPDVKETKNKLPCKIDDLDLQKPPGFVGVVADWIDSQCRYPRRRLAVASAIVAVGNIGGLKYEDDRAGVCGSACPRWHSGRGARRHEVRARNHAQRHRPAGQLLQH